MRLLILLFSLLTPNNTNGQTLDLKMDHTWILGDLNNNVIITFPNGEIAIDSIPLVTPVSGWERMN